MKKHKPTVPASMPREEAQQLVNLFNAGRYADVELRARLLVDLYPTAPFAWKILGTVLLVQGKDGLQALQKTVELLPTDPEAHSNLGNMYKALGRFEEAAASHQRAIQLKPDHALAHYNLGIVLRDLGRSVDAVASFAQAIRLKPDFTDAHFNLGVALTDLDRLEEAAASYRQALALQPKFLGAHCNLGIVLKDMGRYDEAVAAFERLLELKPDDAAAHNNLGNLLKDLGRLDEAAAHCREAIKLKPDYNEAASNLLFALNYVAGQQPEVLLNEAKAYGERVASRVKPCTSWPNTPEADRPLRIGLVSGDLNQHPVGFFMEGVLKALSTQEGARSGGRVSLAP
ncbi:MAG: tetratricopeptide repeat protein, partial [Aquabacterium sp.]|nr:tetratricopeptide repeat protein [Aquabacterium sp.]